MNKKSSLVGTRAHRRASPTPRKLSTVHFQQLCSVSCKHLAPVRFGELKPLDRCNRGPDRPKRRVGCEYHVIGAEELESAPDAVDAAEHGGVAVEIVKIVEVRPLERRQYRGIVLVRGARAE